MKKVILIIAVILASVGSYSQSIVNVNYDICVPTGDLKNFIDHSGTRGLRVNSNWFISDNVTLGGTVGWNAFKQKYDRNTNDLGDGAITSTNWNRLYSVPFLFNAYYHFNPDGNIRPYAGGGLGTYYIEQELQTGMYTSINKNWKVGFSPEVGAYIPIGGGDFGINAKMAYNMVFYDVAGINNLSYLSFSIGIAFGS